MVNYNNFLSAEELLGNNHGTEGFGGAAAGIADDMGVAFGEAKGFGGVDAGVHASDDGDFSINGQYRLCNDNAVCFHFFWFGWSCEIPGSYRPGGRGREPLSNASTYFLLADSNSAATDMMNCFLG